MEKEARTKDKEREGKKMPKERAKAKAKVEKTVLQEKSTHKKATAKGEKGEIIYADPTPL